jgi:hypothetical protein
MLIIDSKGCLLVLLYYRVDLISAVIRSPFISIGYILCMLIITRSLTTWLTLNWNLKCEGVLALN